MKAILFEQFGGPQVLRLSEVADPIPGRGQVRVAIRYAAVNPFDAKLRSGVMQSVFPARLPVIPGREGAGVVDAVGKGASGFAPGDEVMGQFKTGTYAELALAADIVRKPAGMDWETAAALPTSAVTAVRALDQLQVVHGETLLVHGAAGAVGSMAAQLARVRGAVVIGTASPGRHDRLRALGITPLAYGDGVVDRIRAAAPQGVDAVLDAAGHRFLPAAIDVRRTTDRIVTIADPDAQRFGVAVVAGGRANPAVMSQVAELVMAGRVHIEIGGVFPLAAAADAHTLSESGHPGGKLLLRPGG